MAQTLTYPEGRYGRRRDPVYQRRRRWIVWAAGAVVMLGGLAIAFKLYQQYANPPYEVMNINTTEITDTGFTVSFDVRVPAGEGASCTLQGHTRDGVRIGWERIDVPPGSPETTVIRVTHTLTTSVRPMTGEVPGCGPRQQ